MELRAYLPFWPKLNTSQRELLENATRERQFKRGKMLHSGQGDCTGLMLVLQGQLRVYTLSDEGRELTLYRLFPRDLCLFSASCILHSIQFDVMVAAEQDTEVLHIPADTYKQLIEESAPVANYTNELMASRFSDVMWLMDQLLNKKLDTRLAAFLLEEYELEGTESLALTHEQIANHLGSVREVVTRMLKYFQNEGLVRLGRGSIQLLELERLRTLASVSLR
jgi:CRP/FNR family transcriptional regulator